MFSSRIFQFAILISVTIHGVVLLQNANFSIFTQNKQEDKLEISYLKKLKDEIMPPQALLKKEPLLRLDSQVTARKVPPPQFIDKENIFASRKTAAAMDKALNKPVVDKPDIIAVKKKITLPPVDMNKISSPSYINYYQMVREKIRRSAYQNYSGSQIGEAYLSFVITNLGELKDVRLVQEKTSAPVYLREIARKSISDAAPFPKFPAELDYPQLSFNIVISFEIE